MANNIFFQESFDLRLSPFVGELSEMQSNDKLINNLKKNAKHHISRTKDHVFFYKPINDIDKLIHLDNYFFNKEEIEKLVSDKPKLVLFCENGIYHFWLNTAAMCLEWLKKNPLGIIVLLSNSSNYDEMKCINRNNNKDLKLNSDFVSYFKKYLLSIGSDLFIFNFSFVESFPIKNFQTIKDHNQSINKSFIENINKFNQDVHKDKVFNPYRKVYIGRKKVANTEDERIEDETKLEQYLKLLGFEIVYPEDFKNIREQIEYFKTVKTLMAATGSALANGVWMSKYGKLIEISTPITINNLTVIQNIYSQMAYGLGLNYLFLSNDSKNAQEIIDQIEKIDGLKKYLIS